MLADRADEVVGHFVALVHVAAGLAYPAGLAVAGRGGLCGGLGFDMLVVVFVGEGGVVVEQHRLGDLGNEKGVGAQVDHLVHLAADVGVGVARHIEQSVAGAHLHLAVLELVHVAPALESKMLDDGHGCMFGEERHVEQSCADNHVVSVVLFVDGHEHLQGCVGELRSHIDDASVVLVAFAGGEDIKAVAQFKQGVLVVGVHNNNFFSKENEQICRIIDAT